LRALSQKGIDELLMNSSTTSASNGFTAIIEVDEGGECQSRTNLTDEEEEDEQMPPPLDPPKICLWKAFKYNKNKINLNKNN
jgi:hypothetical protein